MFVTSRRKRLCAPTPTPSAYSILAGSAGKVMLLAVRLDTYPKEKRIGDFYIGTNDPGELTAIRRHILTKFKALPIQGEYLHRDAFAIAEKYGKDTFLAI